MLYTHAGDSPLTSRSRDNAISINTRTFGISVIPASKRWIADSTIAAGVDPK